MANPLVQARASPANNFSSSVGWLAALLMAASSVAMGWERYCRYSWQYCHYRSKPFEFQTNSQYGRQASILVLLSNRSRVLNIGPATWC